MMNLADLLPSVIAFGAMDGSRIGWRILDPSSSPPGEKNWKLNILRNV
jgi:hypothetical protein